ncbi:MULTISPECIES: DUF2512 family protein [Bacillaceae]|uniref:DUF2512 family protein n=1 Tax=Metabacillus sediminis TaxID=3117746 RepID=A0ABZ2NBK2_9BACI|nr:DUF2512 family protein [Bacillus sp. SJS]KZZ82631.1 hypothetical protein AS29_017595 [Bacillus sp. SJS]
MNQLAVIAVKFIIAAIAFAIGLDLFFDANITDILSFSLFAALATYLLGDRVVLPALGHRSAYIVEFFTVYLGVWIFGSVLYENYLQIAWGSGISAVIFTAGEVFVHLFLLERMQIAERRSIRTGHAAFGTEFSKELDPLEKNKKD